MEKQSIHTVVTITPNPAIDFMLTTNHWQRGEVNKGDDSYQRVGGKGINVATALAQLDVQKKQGVNVIATGWLGKDNLDIFTQHFQHHNIDDGFVYVEGKTRTNVKITDSHDNDTTDINFSGLAITQRFVINFEQQLQRSLTKNSLCVLAGSLARGLSEDFYANMIPILRQQGHRVILDTSGKALEAVIKRQSFPHIMKPNIGELNTVAQQTLETHADIIKFTKPWFAHGLELLVVSLGESGALFITDAETVKTSPPKVNVTSTVGAGDAMVAGISYGLIQELSLSKIARLATALSVAKITALTGDLTLSAQFEQMLSQVTISNIDR